MFRDRQEAAEQLACRLRSRALHDPLVLAIPRGGVVLGAVLARALGADLDVVLACRLRAPGRPELSLGALAEDGAVYLDPLVRDWPDGVKQYLEVEKRFQADQLARRKKRFRAVRPPAPIVGRSVIVTDDGINSGTTMLSVLYLIRDQRPRELIVAVPVCAAERIEELSRRCDHLITLLAPRGPVVIRRHFLDFPPVSDEEVADLLRPFASGPWPGPHRSWWCEPAARTPATSEAPMSLFRGILCPTDFSDSSEAAFRLAADLARCHRCRLVLLHVLEVPASAYLGGVLVPDPAEQADEARARLERLQPDGPAVEVERRLVEGQPAEEIVQAATETGCDLIVLGTHGRTGVGRLLLGSVAEQVLRNAPCPVLTVKAPRPAALCTSAALPAAAAR